MINETLSLFYARARPLKVGAHALTVSTNTINDVVIDINLVNGIQFHHSVDGNSFQYAVYLILFAGQHERSLDTILI